MKYFVVTVFALLLVSCAAGTDFKRMDTNKLTYGKSTSVDIVQTQGTPNNTGSMTKKDVAVDFIGYAYADANAEADMKGVTPARGQTFFFKDDVLIGSEFTSSWKSDSTDFDDSKIDMIKKGSTTIEEVITLIGEPRGEYIHPLVKNEEERAKVYVYSQTIVSGLTISSKRKELIVSYDPATNIVTDVEFNQLNVE
ncbi:MAG: hypothetical protein CMN56_13020 [Sneathiella sp.]|nr:hypothetical protein [Sneathiella sp.]